MVMSFFHDIFELNTTGQNNARTNPLKRLLANRLFKVATLHQLTRLLS